MDRASLCTHPLPLAPCEAAGDDVRAGNARALLSVLLEELS